MVKRTTIPEASDASGETVVSHHERNHSPDPMSGGGAHRYTAFISYSHTADKQLAPAIQSGLHQFAKPWYSLRASRIFRDDSNLAVNPGLWSSILNALTQSEYFLLLASPDAARSPWIERETSYWLKNRSPQKLLIILTDGTLSWDNESNDFNWDQTTALPTTLRGAFAEEPLHLDFRGLKTQEDLSLHNPVFRERIASITATLKNRPKDELIGEDVRQHQHTKRLAITVVALLIVLLLVALFQWQRAVRRAEESHSHALAVSAQQALAKNDVDLAVRLALEANKIPDAPPLAKQILRQTAYFNPGTRNVFNGHGGAVTSVSVSADGRYGVSGSADRTIIVWDLDAGKIRQRFVGHERAVTSVRISADGNRVLSASADATIKVWELGSTDATLTITGHGKRVNDAVFGPREQTILSASSDNTVRVWRASDGVELRRTAALTAAALTVALTPDADKVVFGTRDDKACLWRYTTEDPPSCDSLQSHAVKDVAISADGTTVYSAAGGWDCGLAAWRIAGRDLRGGRCYEKHDGGHNSLALHPRHRLVLSGSDDNSIVLWRTMNSRNNPGRVLRRFLGHNGQVRSVAFLPGGRRFLSGSEDTTVRLWDLTSSAEIKRFDRFDPIGFLLGADGRHALITSRDDTTLRRVEIATETITPVPSALPHRAGPMILHPNGKTALLSTGARLFLVNHTTGEIVCAFSGGHNNFITSIAVTPDGRGALSGAYGDRRLPGEERYKNALFYWDVRTGKAIRRLRGHAGNVRAVAISPDGRLGASGSDDHTVMLWDLASGQRIETLSGHGDSVQALGFTPDGRHLVTGASDHLLRLWSVKDWRLIRAFRGHTGGIRSLSISPDGRVLLSGSKDGTLRSWDLESGKAIAVVSGLENLGDVVEITFTSEPGVAYTRSWDQTVRFWQIAPPEKIQEWTYANRYVRELFPNEIDRFRIAID